MSEITTVGIDLAKSVLSAHGVDTHGKAVLRKTLSRSKLLELMAQLPACRVGMEACSGAHELARVLLALGHDARIMAPKFIVPYRKNQKNGPGGAQHHQGQSAQRSPKAVYGSAVHPLPLTDAKQQQKRRLAMKRN